MPSYRDFTAQGQGVSCQGLGMLSFLGQDCRVSGWKTDTRYSTMISQCCRVEAVPGTQASCIMFGLLGCTLEDEKHD